MCTNGDETPEELIDLATIMLRGRTNMTTPKYEQLLNLLRVLEVELENVWLRSISETEPR